MECRVIFVAAELLLRPKVPDFLLLRVTDNTMTTDFLSFILLHDTYPSSALDTKSVSPERYCKVDKT